MTTFVTRAIGLGALLVVLTLATGCGDEPGPPPPTVPTDAPPTGTGRPTPVPDPLTADPPDGGTVVPAGQIDAGGLPAGFPALVWTRGARTLGVYGKAGGCTESRAEVLEQNPERVAVRVVQFSTGPGPCTRELRYPPLEVALDADLGARRVVLTGQGP